MSLPNELLWALIGLLLTIGGTFIEASIANIPWDWSDRGIQSQSLGVTYQIGAVLLTGCLGGKNAGALSQIAYLFIGLSCWLSVFSQGCGLDYVREPSFGYLIGFIPGAWLCGWLAFRTRLTLESLTFSSLCGLGIIHICGLVYLGFLSQMGRESISFLNETLLYSVTPLLGQLIIVCVVSLIAFILRKILLY